MGWKGGGVEGWCDGWGGRAVVVGGRGGASAEHRGGVRASHLTDPGSILGVSKIFLRNLNLLRFIDSSALLCVWTVRGKVA